MVLSWAVLYRFLPEHPGPFRLISPGAAIGVTSWVLVSWLFSLVLELAGSQEATYGALAGAIAFLLWMWLSNLTLLIGARINRAILKRRGRARASASRWAAAPITEPLEVPPR